MPPRPSTARRHHKVHRAAKRAVRRRYREVDLALDHVATDLGVSRRQLQRVFHEVGDQTFADYLRQVRVEQALKLLTREPNPLSIRMAAPRVGFRRASRLSEAFGRVYGHSPSEIQPSGGADYDEQWWQALMRQRIGK